MSLFDELIEAITTSQLLSKVTQTLEIPADTTNTPEKPLEGTLKSPAAVKENLVQPTAAVTTDGLPDVVHIVIRSVIDALSRRVLGEVDAAVTLRGLLDADGGQLWSRVEQFAQETGSESNGDLIEVLFGSELGPLRQRISQEGAIDIDQSSALLKLICAPSLSYIARYALAHDLDALELATQLGQGTSSPNKKASGDDIEVFIEGLNRLHDYGGLDALLTDNTQVRPKTGSASTQTAPKLELKWADSEPSAEPDTKPTQDSHTESIDTKSIDTDSVGTRSIGTKSVDIAKWIVALIAIVLIVWAILQGTQFPDTQNQPEQSAHIAPAAQITDYVMS